MRYTVVIIIFIGILLRAESQPVREGCIIPLCPLKTGIINTNDQRFPNVIPIISTSDPSVFAGMEGLVIEIKKEPANKTFMLYMKNSGGILSVYANLKEVFVEPGKNVTRGEILGNANGTMQTGYLLLFQLLIDKETGFPGKNTCINCQFN